jgi:hypothetical protein
MGKELGLMNVYIVMEDDSSNYYPMTSVMGVYSEEGKAELEAERLEIQNRHTNITPNMYRFYVLSYEVED